MKEHWVLDFCKIAESKGIRYRIENRVNGWIETVDFYGKKYFTKSATYDQSKRQYFQGVDPPKMKEHGASLLFCGGRNAMLIDIFLIPWDAFFETLRMGQPVNTYRLPKEYYQYKFYLRDRKGGWYMSVQGGSRPVLDVTRWHYDVSQALSLVDSTSEKSA